MADTVVDYFFNTKNYRKAIRKADVISARVEDIKIKSKIGIDTHGLIAAMGKDFLFEVGLEIYQNYGHEIPAAPTRGVVDQVYIEYKIFEESVCLLVCVPFYTKLIRYLHPYTLGVERRESLLCQLLNEKRNEESPEAAD